MDPANVSPFVVWLGSGECDVTGRAFEMSGGEVCVVNGWSRGPSVDKGRRWRAGRGRCRCSAVSWRSAPEPEPVHGT